MAKGGTIFVCTECGFQSKKWLGRCAGCDSWNTMLEEAAPPPPPKGRRASAPAAVSSTPPKRLSEVGEEGERRLPTAMGELDRVMGGGLVPGSLVLVGGEPGIGKSTLLLQICDVLAAGGPVLYISGEESARQVKMRAQRLGIKSDEVYIAAETNIESVMQNVAELAPRVVIVDSIQTMYCGDLSSAPGSVAQVREATMRIMRYAKENETSFFLVGHVTKEGSLAGPRVLEHMVDCVLYFEGERHQTYRVLRANKNRFGSTNEIGVFEMGEKGLREVANPSMMLLEGRPLGTPGSAVICAMEGSRPVLAEVQALVAPTGFGIPRRSATGTDYNRMTLMIAVLEKRLRLNMQNQDAYVNVAGGIKLDEPATDLGVLTALASSLKSFTIDPDTLILGEVGLTGEVRSINHAQKRAAEAAKMGFKRCILPQANAKSVKVEGAFELIGVGNAVEALRFARDLGGVEVNS